MEAERLGGARQLKLEVWDRDLGQSDDLIGEVLLELADVHAMLRQGQHRADLPSLLLSDPKAKDAAKSRGAVEGSYAPLEPYLLYLHHLRDVCYLQDSLNLTYSLYSLYQARTRCSRRRT